MKLNTIGLAVLAITALMTFAATSASATTLEWTGITLNGSMGIRKSLAGVSLVWSRTEGSLANECTVSNTEGNTTVFTGTKVTGTLSTWTFESCTRPVTVHKAGEFYIEHESGTTNGTVFSENTEVTVGTPFGTVNCKSGAGTDIGTLTGVASGHATLHINGLFNCGFLAPSVRFVTTYRITSPTGLGVSP